MASDSEKRRGKRDDEAAGRGRRAKRPRLDEERTSSERELALHASDEDIFSLGALVSKDLVDPASDVSPDSYPSSDGGGSFQLMKAEEGRVKEEKKKSRKYRGATEEILEGERERERRERRSKEAKRYRRGGEEDEEDEEKRRLKKSSSARSSPRYGGDGGRREREREREREGQRLLYPPTDERYYDREIRRGGNRRGDGRGNEYHYPPRGEGGRREEGYHRHSMSPRPSDLERSSDWREAPRKGLQERDHGYCDRRELGTGGRVRYDRERFENRKHHKRRRSREERIKDKRERQMREREEQTLESDGSSDAKRGAGRSPSGDKIEDWIKELEEGDESEGRGQRERSSSSGDEQGSSAGEEEEEERKQRRLEDRSSVSDDEKSEEGEIAEDNVSSNESGGEERGGDLSPLEGLPRSVTEPILKSRFDDSSGSSSDTEERRKPKKKTTSVAFAQRAQVAYSGYTEIVSGSEHSDDETVPTTSLDAGKEVVGDRTADDAVGTEPEKSVEEQEKEKEDEEIDDAMSSLPPYLPALMGCRNVEEYEWLNRIEEGTYGVVYRARDKRTGEVVALKKLKMEKEKEGFPITSLREINMLLKAKHPNVVFVRELVVGSNMDRIYIVMDYVEHDMKALMETMKQPFLEGEVKILLLQLLRAVHHLHDNWILHRDLKTSNLLLSHKGILKVGDFGLAREYGSPLKPYTPVVVTLWYRAPELLLGCKTYSTAVDMWSVGCIFAEFLQHKPLFMGKSEIDQLNQIFKELGTPSEEIWPGYNELPVVKKVTFTKRPFNNMRKRFPYLTKSGFDLLNKFLTYDPKRRLTGEKALEDQYFKESPLPVDPSMFPTWPAKSEKVRRKSREKSPTPPIGGNYLLNQVEEDGFKITSAVHGKAAVGAGFSLKF